MAVEYIDLIGAEHQIQDIFFTTILYNFIWIE